jgi:hypothetical protein
MLKPAAIMLIGIALMAFGIKRTADDGAFEQRGREAPVKLAAGYTEVTTKKGGSIHSITFEANLTFTAENGQTVTVHKRVPRPLLEDLLAGRQVTISYLPDDPRNNRFGTQRKPTDPSWLWVSALVFLVGLVWFGIRYKSHKSEREYLESRRRSFGRSRSP